MRWTGEVIYSKLSTGRFPDFDDIVKAIGEIISSGKVSSPVSLRVSNGGVVRVDVHR